MAGEHGYAVSQETKDKLAVILDGTYGVGDTGSFKTSTARLWAFVKITDDPSGGSAPCVVSEFTNAGTFSDLTGAGIAYTADTTTIKKNGHYAAQRTGDAEDGKHQWVIQGVLPFTLEVVTDITVEADTDPCRLKLKLRLDTFKYDASGIRVDSTRYVYRTWDVPTKCEEMLKDVACNGDGTLTKTFKKIRVLDCLTCT